MILQIFLLIIGFAVLIKGADAFVDGASSIAGNFKVPKILIGLTIVAFGTSAPEFAISVKSIISGNHDMVIGNVLGSNILNILLILGVSSMFHYLKVKDNTVKKEIPITLLLTMIFATLISDSVFDVSVENALTRSDGIIILLFFTIFIYYLFSMMNYKKDNKINTEYMPLSKSIIFTVCGIIAIIIGSDLVVDSASYIAAFFGLSEKMISLTVIALGTSLPELVTSINASRKGEYDIAIGNVVGSNIFNIGLVIGMPVAIFGGISQINFNYIDVIVMLFSAFMLFMFSANDHKLSKKEGIAFLVLFIAYYSYVIYMG